MPVSATSYDIGTMTKWAIECLFSTLHTYFLLACRERAPRKTPDHCHESRACGPGRRGVHSCAGTGIAPLPLFARPLCYSIQIRCQCICACIVGSRGGGGGAQSDALVSFNGLAVIVEAAGSEAVQQWLRDGPFFQHPDDDAVPPQTGALGAHPGAPSAGNLPRVPSFASLSPCSGCSCPG